MEPKHTPTPWTVDLEIDLEHDGNKETALEILGTDGSSVGYVVGKDEDAAYIVRAVNSFDADQAELARLRNCHEEMLAFVREVKRVADEGLLTPEWAKAAKQIITKAEVK